jgi:hypothetical protein
MRAGQTLEVTDPHDFLMSQPTVEEIRGGHWSVVEGLSIPATASTPMTPVA